MADIDPLESSTPNADLRAKHHAALAEVHRLRLLLDRALELLAHSPDSGFREQARVLRLAVGGLPAKDDEGADRCDTCGAVVRRAPQPPPPRSTHPALPFVRHAAHGTSDNDPRRLALRALLDGNPRGAAALLVRAEARGSDLLQVRLALNHLPTAWVIACRAIEDVNAAGARVDVECLRAAAVRGDPAVLREALRLELAETPPGRHAVAAHLQAALEAVEREAAAPCP